jgi:REP element-mobilizing transposase RayT
MNEYESLSHTTWDCKYHVVFIPKCRRKTLYQELRRHLDEVFRKLALQKDSKVEEGHLMPDHVRWIPTRSATPSTALVPQRKVGFPIPNAGLLLGFQGTKTARREGISSPLQ